VFEVTGALATFDADYVEFKFGILVGNYEVNIQDDSAVLGLVKITPGPSYGSTSLYWSYKMIATRIADDPANPAVLKITWSAQVVINTSGSSGVSQQASGTDTKIFPVADIADTVSPANVAFSAYMSAKEFLPNGWLGPPFAWSGIATKRHHLFRHVAYSS
jgi:hypothetical protein